MKLIKVTLVNIDEKSNHNGSNEQDIAHDVRQKQCARNVRFVKDTDRIDLCGPHSGWLWAKRLINKNFTGRNVMIHMMNHVIEGPECFVCGPTLPGQTGGHCCGDK